MNFTISQRRWLAENFKDSLVSLEVEGEPYFKRLGPTVQAVMREAVQFTVLNKPLDFTVKEEKHKDTGEEVKVEMITITINVFQPGTNDEIKLERTVSKALLETM